MAFKSYDACLSCDDGRQGWVEGTSAYPGHDCVMCREHCSWVAYWHRVWLRGREPEMRRLYLATQARAKGTRLSRR